MYAFGCVLHEVMQVLLCVRRVRSLFSDRSLTDIPGGMTGRATRSFLLFSPVNYPQDHIYIIGPILS